MEMKREIIMTVKWHCFLGHEVAWGVASCPKCGATCQEQSNVATTDIITSEQSLVVLEKQNEVLLKWLGSIAVTCTQDRVNCGDMLINARSALKEAEAIKKEAQRPLKDELKRVDGYFNPFIDKLTMGISAITKAMSDYDLAQEKEVDQSTGEITAVTTPKTTQANVGSFSKLDGFDIEVTDARLVPREYCEPSLVKLRAGFKLVDEIPGAIKIPKKIYQTRQK